MDTHFIYLILIIFCCFVKLQFCLLNAQNTTTSVAVGGNLSSVGSNSSSANLTITYNISTIVNYLTTVAPTVSQNITNKTETTTPTYEDYLDTEYIENYPDKAPIDSFTWNRGSSLLISPIINFTNIYFPMTLRVSPGVGPAYGTARGISMPIITINAEAENNTDLDANTTLETESNGEEYSTTTATGSGTGAETDAITDIDTITITDIVTDYNTESTDQ